MTVKTALLIVGLLLLPLVGCGEDPYGVCGIDPHCERCCDTGQPCGDTCISRDRTCRTNAGTACWASVEQTE